MAVAAGGGDKSWSRSVSNILTDYLRATYHLEDEKEKNEQSMLEEYKKFKHLRPKVKIGKDGALTVTGIPTEIIN